MSPKPSSILLGPVLLAWRTHFYTLTAKRSEVALSFHRHRLSLRGSKGRCEASPVGDLNVTVLRDTGINFLVFEGFAVYFLLSVVVLKAQG